MIVRNFVLFVASLVAFVACDTGSAPGSRTASAQFAEDRYASAVNAKGESVSLSDFSGKPVWVDYAAEWCAACRGQSATIRALARELGDKVVFITVMTSEVQGYGHPATQETAARWAKRESLDPARA